MVHVWGVTFERYVAPQHWCFDHAFYRAWKETCYAAKVIDKTSL